MKKMLFVVLFLFLFPSVVFAEDEGFGIIDEYAELYGTEIEKSAEKVDNVDFGKLVPGFDISEIISGLARGESVFSVQEILNKGADLLAGEIRNVLKILVFVVAVGVLSTYLAGMQSSFNGKEAVNAAFFVCYLVIVGIVAAAFLETVSCGKAVISNLSVFMKNMAPIALVATASSGAVVSASAFEIILIGVIEITEWILESFFIPLILMTAALCAVNNLSESLNAEKLVQFLNKTVKWGIGLVMTLFVGIMGLQSIVSGSADGLTVKVTRFATSHLIPLVGGALSETVETVMNCSVVIKNAVGVMGIITVILIVAVPVIKISACLIMFRLCAAILQPVCDKKIVKCISEFADAISSVFGLVAVVAVMFVVMLTIIINMGNSAILLGR
ncbi:MAG: stage III sporulation protein AE [Clostridia bacterium]|nr:stage III sporulation protein AE [Clostridia bacterium]